MKWINFLSLLLLIGLSISTISLAPAISYYLEKSGIVFLSSGIKYLNYFTIFVSCGVLALFNFITKKWSKIISYIPIYIVYLTAIFEFYCGILMIWDNKGFISTLYEKWVKISNNFQLKSIEKTFNCCSFHYFGEFEDHCSKAGISDTCLNVMSNTLQESTDSIGYTFVFHAIIHCFVAILLEMINDSKKSEISYDAGEWNNNIEEEPLIQPDHM